jgi:hypothetical protein
VGRPAEECKRKWNERVKYLDWMVEGDWSDAEVRLDAVVLQRLIATRKMSDIDLLAGRVCGCGLYFWLSLSLSLPLSV